MTSTPEFHCQSCLDGAHLCSIYVPWGDRTRCVCKRCTSHKALDVAVTPKPTPDKHGDEPRKPGPKGPSRWTDEALAELLAMAAQGLTSRQIGEKIGREAVTVRHALMVARRKGVAA